MSKIFLTGSTGFIGSHLLKKLQKLNHEVMTDIRYLETEKYDLVIHLGAVTHIRTEFDPSLFEANIILSKKVLSTPFRTIYASSCSAKYLTNPYAYTKRYCEWLGEKHGNALGLRFFNVYGPGNNKGIVNHLMNQKYGATIEVKGSSLIRDYIYIDDVVDYIVYQMNYNITGVLDVGTGVGTRTIDLVQTFEKISKKEFNIKTNEDWGGGNEPTEMISSNKVKSIPLKKGLLKTINDV